MRTKQLFMELLMFFKDHLFGKTAEATYTIEEILAESSKVAK